MELLDFVGLAAIPFIVGLVELVKPFIADKRFYPIVAVTIGVILNLIVAWQLDTGYVLAVLLGALVGLAASGLYSAGATIRAGAVVRVGGGNGGGTA